jgi:membrane fusion protein (multidrug efflux system)
MADDQPETPRQDGDKGTDQVGQPDKTADKTGSSANQKQPNQNTESKTDGDQRSPEQKRRDERKARRRKIVIRLIFLVILVVAAIGAFLYWFSTRNLIDTDDAFTDGRAISIAPRIAGRVTALLVNDNQRIKKGDVIIQLDPRDYQTALTRAAGQLAQAKAQLANAQLALDKASTTYPAQLLSAQGSLEQAQGNLTNAQSDFRRQHAVSRAATTQQQVDQSTASLRQAEGQVKVAQAQVDSASVVQQNIDQAKAQVDQLRGQVQQAQGQYDQAKLNVSYTTVRAPQDGWVTRRNVESGDYLTTGQTIMNLVAPDVWVTANFKENQLDRMRPDQVVDITVDAYPGLKLRGHVDSVQMGSGSRFSAFPAENATGNFVKIVQRVPVKIDIDSGLDPNLPLPLGLSVNPTVKVKDYIQHAQPSEQTQP